MPRSASLASAIVCGAVLVIGLGGCATDVPMTPAEDANDPACADLIVRLPDEVAGLAKRTTNAQATGAWGDPVGVQLVCGETPSGPTTDPCLNVSGIDWIVDGAQAPLYRVEAYGRTPGLVLYIDTERASSTDALLGLSPIAKLLPQERECTSVTDTVDG